MIDMVMAPTTLKDQSWDTDAATSTAASDVDVEYLKGDGVGKPMGGARATRRGVNGSSAGGATRAPGAPGARRRSRRSRRGSSAPGATPRTPPGPGEVRRRGGARLLVGEARVFQGQPEEERVLGRAVLRRAVDGGQAQLVGRDGLVRAGARGDRAGHGGADDREGARPHGERRSLCGRAPRPPADRRRPNGGSTLLYLLVRSPTRPRRRSRRRPRASRRRPRPTSSRPAAA